MIEEQLALDPPTGTEARGTPFHFVRRRRVAFVCAPPRRLSRLSRAQQARVCAERSRRAQRRLEAQLSGAPQLVLPAFLRHERAEAVKRRCRLPGPQTVSAAPPPEMTSLPSPTSTAAAWNAFVAHLPTHPVLQLLYRRRDSGSRPRQRTDPYRLALAIEGGGMRGSVAAGMCAALKYLGFADAIDVVYGSSAGSICGAYLVSRQLPLYGASVYFGDVADRRFIDKRALLYPYIRRQRARPVLDLDLLLDDIMVNRKPIDWESFIRHHQVQPLRPVASSLTRMRSTALDGIESLEQLRNALRASARVPGIAGPLVTIGDETFADASLFEPIPYRTALAEGCTHVLVLRTRPFGAQVPRHGGLYERLVAAPEFRRFPAVREHLIRGGHHRLYRDDLRRLEDPQWQRHADVREAVGARWTPSLPPEAYVLPIAPPPGSREVNQLEVRPPVIFAATRHGFELAHNVLQARWQLAPDAGARAARLLFTDQLLQQTLQEKRLASSRRVRPPGKRREGMASQRRFPLSVLLRRADTLSNGTLMRTAAATTTTTRSDRKEIAAPHPFATSEYLATLNRPRSPHRRRFPFMSLPTGTVHLPSGLHPRTRLLLEQWRRIRSQLEVRAPDLLRRLRDAAQHTLPGATAVRQRKEEM